MAAIRVTERSSLGDAKAELRVRTSAGLLQDSAVFAGTAIAVIGLNALSSILVARHLASTEAYGRLSIVLSVLAMFTPFAVLSIPEGVTKLVAESGDPTKPRPRAILTTALGFMSITSASSAIILIFAGELMANRLYGQRSLGLLFPVASLFILAAPVAALVLAALRGLEKVRWLSIVNLINASASVPLVLLLLPGLGLLGAVLAIAVNPIVPVVVGGLMLYRHIDQSHSVRSPSSGGAILGQLLRFSSPLFVSTLLLALFAWFINTLLVLDGSFSDAGQFRISYNLYSIFITMTSAVAVPLMPLVSRLRLVRKESVPELVTDVLRIVVFLTTPLLLATSIFSRELISVLYGSGYVPAWEATFAMMTAVAAASILPAASAVLQGLGRTWQILKFDSVFGICLLISSVLLIPWAGSLGAGISYSLSYAVLAGLIASYLHKHGQIRPRAMLHPLILVSSFFVAAYLIVTELDGISHTLAGAACVAGSTVACWRLMTTQERGAVLRLLVRRQALPETSP